MKADLPLGGFLGILQNITKSFPYQNGLSFTNKICGFFFKRSVEIPKVRDHQFSTYVHIFQKKLTFCNSYYALSRGNPFCTLCHKFINKVYVIPYYQFLFDVQIKLMIQIFSKPRFKRKFFLFYIYSSTQKNLPKNVGPSCFYNFWLSKSSCSQMSSKIGVLKKIS